MKPPITEVDDVCIIALTEQLSRTLRIASTAITRTVRPYYPWSQPPSSLLA